MFGIGMTELLVILVLGLLVLGPKRLPGLARSLGRSLAEFRRASNDIRREFMDVAEEVRMEPPSLSDAESPARQAKARDDANGTTLDSATLDDAKPDSATPDDAKPDGATPDDTSADPKRDG